MNNSQAKEVNLTTNEALILQQIYEDGGDDVVILAGQIGLSRRTAINILSDLRHKGLMVIDQTYGNAWVQLTTRGKRLVQKIWPEAQMIATH
jgi:hypothetical protein cdiviTM7_02395